MDGSSELKCIISYLFCTLDVMNSWATEQFLSQPAEVNTAACVLLSYDCSVSPGNLRKPAALQLASCPSG